MPQPGPQPPATAEVLVIGGGINGIATFRDLALQGVDVVLVERGDIVSGASSASSHMIHGGIRYLENGEFRLVHEAVTERNRLLRIAPHYVRPLETTIPIFSTFSGILAAPLRFLRHGSSSRRERGALLIKLGLVIYDSFSRGGGQVPRHRFQGRARSLKELPHLNPALKYTATYWDASLHDPERLAVDLMREGEAAGGRVHTYTSAVGVRDDAIVLRDEQSGAERTLAAKVVVNATGPWVDLTEAALGRETHLMGGTKGSHIVLDHPELFAATGGREIFFEHRDGRIVLVYPLKNRVLVGTSDLEHDMRDPIVCTDEEVDYFLDLIGHVFPSIPVSRDQIVYRFAGVRPLPGHGDLAPGFVSRDYRIERGEVAGSVQLTLVGGKWTTFRASAEHLADRVLDELGRPRRVSTARLPIGGGRGYPVTQRARQRWLEAYGSRLPRRRAAELLTRYGTRAEEIIEACLADPSDRPLRTAPAFSTAEIRYLCAHERVVRLADLVMRRTSLAMRGRATPEVLEELAELGGWDPADEVPRALVEVHRAYPGSEAAVGASGSVSKESA